MVGPADNYLPPDNFQEDPPVGIAHRTSPTNIGLSLLSNLAAYDFGYITAGEVMARTSRTLAAVDKLQRYRGHLYNWYDTRTLEPLRRCTSRRSTAATSPAICSRSPRAQRDRRARKL